MLYTTGNNWNCVFACLQDSLTCFDIWCMRNNMVLNVSKSKCLVIGGRHKLSSNVDYEHKLVVRNISLDYVKKFLYLGMYLESEMALNPFDITCKKVGIEQNQNLGENSETYNH